MAHVKAELNTYSDAQHPLTSSEEAHDPIASDFSVAMAALKSGGAVGLVAAPAVAAMEEEPPAAQQDPVSQDRGEGAEGAGTDVGASQGSTDTDGAGKCPRCKNLVNVVTGFQTRGTETVCNPCVSKEATMRRAPCGHSISVVRKIRISQDFGQQNHLV